MTAIPPWLTLLIAIIGLLGSGGAGGVLLYAMQTRQRQAENRLKLSQTVLATAETAVEHTKAEGEQFTLVERLQKYLEQTNEARAEKERLERKLGIVESDGVTLKRRVDDLDAQLRLVNDDRARLLMDNAKLTSELHLAQTVIAEQGAKIATLETKVQRLQESA